MSNGVVGDGQDWESQYTPTLKERSPMISRYRVGGALKTKLALLGAVIACVAGVWAPAASATTTTAPTPAASTACTGGAWSGYWTWDSSTHSWYWTWVWYPCTNGYTVS
jgi:hypothetical protein